MRFWPPWSLRLLLVLKWQAYIISLEFLLVLKSLPVPFLVSPTDVLLDSPYSQFFHGSPLTKFCKVSPLRVCACVHVCVLNCSIKCGSFYRLPGFGDQQIRHSPVLKAAMWQTQNPHLDPVGSARRKGWAGWRRQWPQIIPCFPSITQSRGRMGGSKAKGNFPGNEKPLGLLRELGHRPT